MCTLIHLSKDNPWTIFGRSLGGSVRDLFLFAEGEFEGLDEVFGEVGEGAKD